MPPAIPPRQERAFADGRTWRGMMAVACALLSLFAPGRVADAAGLAEESSDPALACMDQLVRTFASAPVAIDTDVMPVTGVPGSRDAQTLWREASARIGQRSGVIRMLPGTAAGAVPATAAAPTETAEAEAFIVQGTVAQLDASIRHRVGSGETCLGAACIADVAGDRYSALGFEAQLLRANDRAPLPGMSASIAVLIARHTGRPGGALRLHGLGRSFAMELPEGDPSVVALRTVIELGAIELYGRLFKVPYWNCLHVADRQSEVASEIAAWWALMAADQPALVRWLQQQMRARTLYAGAIDGVVSTDLLRALAVYKGALGLAEDAQLDLAFYRAYLAADHARLQGPAREVMERLVEADPLASALPARSAADPAAAGTLVVRDPRPDRRNYTPGEVYEVQVPVDRDGYLYCWLLDDKHHLEQFFPNRVQRSPRVRAGTPVNFPGNFRFTLTASLNRLTESVVCALAARDLGFNPIGTAVQTVQDVNGLRATFSRAAGADFDFGVMNVQSH